MVNKYKKQINNYVIDGHIHIEHQPYNLELIDNMVDVALSKGIDEIRIVDHTHKFKEFRFLYDNESCKDEITLNHYKDKCAISINEYLDFIRLVKKQTYPIVIKFGLEVCYFKCKEESLKKELSKYNFDFLIGSIHHVDGFAYDLFKDSWKDKDVDYLYKEYFKAEGDLIKSNLFTHIAHPDAIKIFGYTPSFSLIHYYERIAKLLSKYNLSTENNTGFARFGFTNYGLNKEFLKILKENNVKLIKSSDAHKYQDIGNKFEKIEI